jgi:hypothetical protein
MRRRTHARERLVVSARHDRVVDDDDRADGDFTGGQRKTCLIERGAHVRLVHHVVPSRRT